MKLVDQMREQIRLRNSNRRTEEAYTRWAVRFIRYHQFQHPQHMHDREVVEFLTYLAVERNVSASTQNQALNALVFLYRQGIHKPLGDISSSVRAKKPVKLPVVLDRSEVARVLRQLQGIRRIIGALLYGSGLRLLECLQLRVKDLDFEYCAIHIEAGKGNKDRVVNLSPQLVRPLKDHLQQIRLIHKADLERGFGKVWMPNALARKYPNANREWGWQYVFPSTRISVDPRSGRQGRHHQDISTFQKSIGGHIF